jgi:antitoxin ChpS
MLDTGILIQPMPVCETEWQHPETYPNPNLLANIRRDGITL